MSGDKGGGVRRPRPLARAVVGPGPLRELKDLLYEVYTAAGAPSLNQIAADIGEDDTLAGAPERDSIRRCISDSGVPAQQADVVAVAMVLARRARWNADDLASRVTDLWVKARLVAPPGKPLTEVTDPFALEVHQAITLDLPGSARDLPVLPVYVKRGHDARLRTLAEEVADGASRLVVLTGGSSTGKTRACWEVLHHLPNGWRLWHPYDPTRPEAALAVIEQLAPRTVVWLNEAQHYLLTASDLGERLAAKLRSLLTDTGRAPVLVLATMWPEYWNTLTTAPDPGSVDPHAQARAQLTDHDLPIPPVFSDTDLRSLAEHAKGDPRLAYAAHHADAGAITQYLAGAPALLQRYHTASPGARALIEAAMDVRRLGHNPSLTLALLEAAASGYHSDDQWDLLGEDWLEQALAYTAKPIRGARGPITRIRPRPGQPAPAQPHYRLADYLEQHGRRRTTRTTKALWDALIDHAPATDRLTLAQAAQSRGLYRIAIDLCADAGDAALLMWAADQLADADRLDEALSWYERAADAGDTTCLRQAAKRLAAAGRLDEALPWYERAGDTTALRSAAHQLAVADRWEEALGWWQRAADAGDTEALQLAAELMAASGRLDKALSWYERAAEAGHTEAPGWAADRLAAADRLDEALTWYERAAEAGHTTCLRRAAERLTEADRLDEALTWYEHAVEAGHTDAPGWAAVRLTEAGRRDEAQHWWQRAVEAGLTEAAGWAAERLAEADRLDEALTWYERAGDSIALQSAAHWLADAARLDEALPWWQRAADAGDIDALQRAAEWLVAVGRFDEALAWYDRAADAGCATALQAAADQLAESGQSAAAKNLRRYGREPNQLIAAPWNAG
ncbi:MULTISPECIES: AAA family ATPase [unclassified Streptomyces]|uniref:AAA family ATPase n=2 Tax=Streptomyces TaxID=1883 RepID=UPI0033A4985D